MAPMFDNKIRSFFPKHKPLLVDGCCEPETCCNPFSNCGFSLYYEIPGRGGSEQVAIDGSTAVINITELAPENQILLYLVSDIGDTSISSISLLGDFTGDWLVPGILPVTVAELATQLIGTLEIGYVETGNYSSVYTAVTSCGQINITFNLGVENAQYCQYNVDFQILDELENAVEIGTVPSTSSPASYNLTTVFTVGDSRTIVFNFEPLGNNIDITSITFGGAFSLISDLSPLTVNVLTNPLIAQAEVDTTVGSPKTGTIEIVTSCGTFNLSITYNTVVP